MGGQRRKKVHRSPQREAKLAERNDRPAPAGFFREESDGAFSWESEWAIPTQRPEVKELGGIVGGQELFQTRAGQQLVCRLVHTEETLVLKLEEWVWSVCGDQEGTKVYTIVPNATFLRVDFLLRGMYPFGDFICLRMRPVGELVLGSLFALPNPEAEPDTYGDRLMRGKYTSKDALWTRKPYEAGLWLFHLLAVKSKESDTL